MGSESMTHVKLCMCYCTGHCFVTSREKTCDSVGLQVHASHQIFFKKFQGRTSPQRGPLKGETRRSCSAPSMKVNAKFPSGC